MQCDYFDIDLSNSTLSFENIQFALNVALFTSYPSMIRGRQEIDQEIWHTAVITNLWFQTLACIECAYIFARVRVPRKLECFILSIKCMRGILLGTSHDESLFLILRLTQQGKRRRISYLESVSQLYICAPFCTICTESNNTCWPMQQPLLRPPMGAPAMTRSVLARRPFIFTMV